MKCRICAADLHFVLDLDLQPSANALLVHRLDDEKFYPLKTAACLGCGFMQLTHDVAPEELFTARYPYRTSGSRSLVAHFERYAEMIKKRLQLGDTSNIMEAGGNDGSLLKCFGGLRINVEPSAEAAEESKANGVPTACVFFEKLALMGEKADLIIANNVMAHTPDLHGFAAAVKRMLAPHGTATIEFSSLVDMLMGVHFDAIYHEHYSYLSVRAAQRLFAMHGLEVYDVEELPQIHGGSVRLYVGHSGFHLIRPGVGRELTKEVWLSEMGMFLDFAEAALRRIEEMQDFVYRAGGQVMGAGAAAKGVTFINSCKFTAGDITSVTDATPAKQGKYLPGSLIPVVPEDVLKSTEPKYLIVFAHNWADEIIAKLRPMLHHTKFVIPRAGRLVVTK